MKSLSVLVADDEEDIIVLVQHWLAAAAYDSVAVQSATEAFAALKRQKFDLVITDVLMPDGDGLDLINKLKTAQPSVRILAISGGGHYVRGDDCLKLARGLGAHAIVLKPFTWQQLHAGMNQALAPIPEQPTGNW